MSAWERLTDRSKVSNLFKKNPIAQGERGREGLKVCSSASNGKFFRF